MGNNWAAGYVAILILSSLQPPYLPVQARLCSQGCCVVFAGWRARWWSLSASLKNAVKAQIVLLWQQEMFCGTALGGYAGTSAFVSKTSKLTEIHVCVCVQTERGNVRCFQMGELSSLFPGHIKNTSLTAALMLLYWQDYCLGDTGDENKFINLSGWASPPFPAEARTAAFPATHLNRIKFLWKSLFKCRIELRGTLSVTMLTPM